MKKKISLIILSLIVLLLTIKSTLAFYNTSSNHINTFKIEDYIITIDGTGGTFKNENIKLVGSSTTLPTPYKKGYTFLGYSSTSNGNVEYNNTIKNINDINNKKIYAIWHTNTYSIDYNLNGGTISNAPQNYNVTQEFTLPTPSKRGYTFTGWSGTDINGLSKNVVISKGSIGDRSYTANWHLDTYSISYDLDGGSISNQPNSYNVNDTITLPQPTKKGYTFTGWSGTDINGISKDITISNNVGNKKYKANWSKNSYVVSYYVNGNLWTQRTVAYGDNIENLNAQSLLDIYHTFHGWNNWVDTMPDYNISLIANITESYCMLMTGHGPYGNATALLKVFQDAGWSGRVEIAPSAPNYYWVVTDYTLTRAQAEVQKDYIARHTNYKNYNFPYLYWVAVSCTNGYSEAWTRSSGQLNFN